MPSTCTATYIYIAGRIRVKFYLCIVFVRMTRPLYGFDGNFSYINVLLRIVTKRDDTFSHYSIKIIEDNSSFLTFPLSQRSV
jgi:hypothetical protein